MPSEVPKKPEIGLLVLVNSGIIARYFLSLLMAKKPTKAELQKAAEDQAHFRSFLESDDPLKRNAAIKALFRVAPRKKYGMSPEEALRMMLDDDICKHDDQSS